MKFTIRNMGFFLFAVLGGLSSCVKEAVDYTYEISGLEWVSEGSDADEDGFVTSRSLRCTFSLLQLAVRDVTIKVYYRLEGTQDYIFYTKIDQPGISGITEQSVLINIGQEQELSRGSYSFLIELYETGSSITEASMTIDGIQFERLVNDQLFDLNPWWSDFDDKDRDGYATLAQLNVDINVRGSVSKRIKAEVLVKASGSMADYRNIYRGDYYNITGDDPDTLQIPFGIEPDTLLHGSYDVRIVVYEKNVFTPVLIYDGELSEQLRERKFESPFEDVFFFSLNQSNCGWMDVVDEDSDGYSQSRVLALDFDVDKEEEVNVYALIYREGDADEHSLILDSTGIFTVKGKTITDLIPFPISSTSVTDSVQMPHGSYNFMLMLYEIIPEGDPDLIFATDSINGQILFQQKFELISEDK